MRCAPRSGVDQRCVAGPTAHSVFELDLDLALPTLPAIGGLTTGVGLGNSATGPTAFFSLGVAGPGELPELGAGNSSVKDGGASALAARAALRGATERTTRLSFTAAPTRYGRAGLPSTEISA